MATYFHCGPEVQPVDGLQTLYLMNPSYVGYSDANGLQPGQQQTNMVFLNSPLNSLNSTLQQQQHQHQQQQHFTGIPLQPSQQPTPQYNIWAPTLVDVQAHQGPIRSAGLSLTLQSTEEGKILAGPSTNGLQSVLMGSKYLKAVQQLLDEVASVVKDGRSEVAPTVSVAEKGEEKSWKDLEGERGDGKRGAELSTAERLELQMKKAKLINMLEEVEQRYRQYHQQMQLVISSFESIVGFNSARTYTSLALQTISKQFRWLKDAITGQIRATSKRLGEEDYLGAGGSKSVGSRLRFVDHHLRQQRVLQQLGMIQHNAWRPQRGLPERAVSVLRAWLFEHFLHPYPKDSDKRVLAKQTGLTRSQVSNWFINARVRLWKPMVEEMYLEETKEQDQNNNNNDKSETSEHSASKFISQQPNSSTPSRAEKTGNNLTSADLAIFDCKEESIMQQRLTKARSNESLQQNTVQNQMSMEMKSDELSNRKLLMKFIDQGGGFGGYPIGEIGRFAHHEQFAPRFGGNGVSLTLGLPHCDTLSVSGSQQPAYISNESIQMGRRIDLTSEENNYFNNNNNGNNPRGSTPPNAYESINIQNRKRFAAQLLPDFVP